MAKSNERLSVSSPLSQLVPPGTLRQEPFPAFHGPRNPSRFSLPRIAHYLKRTVADIHPFRRGLIPGNSITLQGNVPGSPRTQIIWLEDADQSAQVVITIPHATHFSGEPGRLILETDNKEDGPSAIVTTTGGVYFSPLPMAARSRRLSLEQSQAGLPWYEQSPEILHNKRIECEAIVTAAPEYPPVTSGEESYGYFTVAVGPEGKEFAVYAYVDQGQEGRQPIDRIALLRRRNLKEGEKVSLTAYTKVGRQFVSKGEQVPRVWCRLLDVTRLPKSV